MSFAFCPFSSPPYWEEGEERASVCLVLHWRLLG